MIQNSDLIDRSKLLWFFSRLTTNGDQCARCSSYFRFIDFSTCPYHSLSSITNGKHDCCSQLVSTFDILHISNQEAGCQKREHVCRKQNFYAEIYENLDKVELLKYHPTLRCSTININLTPDIINKVIEQSIYGSTNTNTNTKQAQWTAFLNTHPFGSDVKYLWDATKSTRWNQDIQREDEHRRFDEMLRYIQTTQQTNKTQNTRTVKETTSTSFISPGGIYCRIESEWRTRQTGSMNTNNNTLSTNRNRPRIAVKNN